MSSQSVTHRRLPNFEILRVLAMFLIIVGHFFFSPFGCLIDFNWFTLFLLFYKITSLSFYALTE